MFKFLGLKWDYVYTCNEWRDAVAHLVEALCYKQEGSEFESRLSHWNFSLT
jgi:hypothetical protein